MGMKAWRIEDPETCGEILDAALAHDGPALVDAIVDPDEPMLPPKRRADYVQKFEQALAKMPEQRPAIERTLGEEPARTSLKP
jgi:pyruvate dehydrogenase (quinone)